MLVAIILGDLFFIRQPFTEMISPVPAVNRAPVDVVSDTKHQEDSEDEGEYMDDDESDEEGGDSEDEDKVESSWSKEHPTETRSKAR